MTICRYAAAIRHGSRHCSDHAYTCAARLVCGSLCNSKRSCSAHTVFRVQHGAARTCRQSLSENDIVRSKVGRHMVICSASTFTSRPCCCFSIYHQEMYCGKRKLHDKCLLTDPMVSNEIISPCNACGPRHAEYRRTRNNVMVACSTIMSMFVKQEAQMAGNQHSRNVRTGAGSCQERSR